MWSTIGIPIYPIVMCAKYDCNWTSVIEDLKCRQRIPAIFSPRKKCNPSFEQKRLSFANVR